MTETYVATIGDISISPHWVNSPSGQFPLRGTTWTVSDTTREDEAISPLGIILCLLFVWVCFIGLFFLLMKEHRISGYIQVTVRGSNGVEHSTMLPATSNRTAWEVNQAVNYVRSLAAVA